MAHFLHSADSSWKVHCAAAERVEKAQLMARPKPVLLSQSTIRHECVPLKLKHIRSTAVECAACVDFYYNSVRSSLHNHGNNINNFLFAADRLRQ